MTPTAPVFRFECTICGDPSESICCYCTKDSCRLHICEKCGRCSDCCVCEAVRAETAEPAHQTVQ